MTDKTHQVIGLTASTATIFYTQPNIVLTTSVIATVVISSFIGSLAPDIDQPTDQLWQKIPLGGLFGHVTAAFLGGHRNLSHSILGVGLFGGLAWWILGLMPDTFNHILAWQTFMIGFTAHLLADAVTVMGIPLFWPFWGNMGFPPHPFDGIRIVTGKWFENWIVLPLFLFLFGALIFLYSGRYV